jgi:hypothetical protein
VRRVHWRVEVTPSEQQVLDEILSYGPLHLKGRCKAPELFGGPPGLVELLVSSDAIATANWFFVEEGSASANGLALGAGSGDSSVHSRTSGHLEGTLIYDWAGGTISVALHAFHIYSGSGNSNSTCEIYGTALQAT